MADQPAFRFAEDDPMPGPVQPAAPALPPINGTTTRSRHASATGALSAWKDRSPNIKRLRELWRVPRTLQEVEALSGLPLASVCSLKAAIEDELVDVGLQTVEWGEGRRPTKRTLWQLKSARSTDDAPTESAS